MTGNCGEFQSVCEIVAKNPENIVQNKMCDHQLSQETQNSSGFGKHLFTSFPNQLYTEIYWNTGNKNKSATDTSKNAHQYRVSSTEDTVQVGI